jgi:hypothetical protein
LTAKSWFETAAGEARKLVHPDVGGGSHEKFIKLQEASEVLAAFHNAKGKGA